MPKLYFEALFRCLPWKLVSFMLLLSLALFTSPGSSYGQRCAITQIENSNGVFITFSYDMLPSETFRVGDTVNLWVDIVPQGVQIFTHDAFVILASEDDALFETGTGSAEVLVFGMGSEESVWTTYGTYKDITAIVNGITWISRAHLIGDPDIISFLIESFQLAMEFWAHLTQSGYEEGEPSQFFIESYIPRFGVDVESCQVGGYRFKIPIKLTAQGDISLGIHTTYKKYWSAYSGASTTWDFTVEPAVWITSFENGDTVSGIVNVMAQVPDSGAMDSISLFVDDQLIGEMTSIGANSYSLEWDTSYYSPGSHRVKVGVTDNDGYISRDVIQVNVDNSMSLTANLDPEMVQKGASFTISGTLSDSQGAGLEGVDVCAGVGGSTSLLCQTTTGGGGYTISAVAPTNPGPYLVNVSATHFGAQTGVIAPLTVIDPSAGHDLAVRNVHRIRCKCLTT